MKRDISLERDEAADGIDPFWWVAVVCLCAALWILAVLLVHESRRTAEKCVNVRKGAGSVLSAELAASEERFATERMAEEHDRMRQPGEPTAAEERMSALEGLTDISNAVRDEPPRTKAEE